MNRRKGWDRALYACMAIVVVGAGLSFYGINKSSDKKPSENVPQVSEEVPTQHVGVNRTPRVEVSMEEREAKAAANNKKAEPQKAETKEVFLEETDYAQTGGFAENPLFQFPLQGEIVMDYSMDHAIYDKTLEQYRTNNCVSISGKKGEKVKASEGGTVKSVSMDDERGMTVVINHNNGWETTYSQLEKDVLVAKGDKIKKGQEIGILAEPTRYGVLLGNHLDFCVTKDGAYVDPKSALAE